MNPDYHITTCPRCDGSLETVEFEGEKPVQALVQECESSRCEFGIRQGIVWYPDDTYTVIATAVGDDECTLVDCGRAADARLQNVEEQFTKFRCVKCLTVGQRRALQQSEVIDDA